MEKPMTITKEVQEIIDQIGVMEMTTDELHTVLARNQQPDRAHLRAANVIVDAIRIVLDRRNAEVLGK
jgi:hypothetical protein